MGVYLTKRDVNFGGKIIPAGSKVSLDEYDKEFVDRLVAKGSIVEATDCVASEPQAPVTVPEAPQAAESAPVLPEVGSGNPTAEQIAQELKDAGV